METQRERQYALTLNTIHVYDSIKDEPHEIEGEKSLQELLSNCDEQGIFDFTSSSESRRLKGYVEEMLYIGEYMGDESGRRLVKRMEEFSFKEYLEKGKKLDLIVKEKLTFE